MMNTIKRLFIAEKPSLARAIADVLPGPQNKQHNHIICGEGDVVAWCVGHIMALAPPDVYATAFKTWRIDDLPIIPDKWQLIVSIPDIFNGLKALLDKAQSVVHAGDPDREGQLLVDEVLHYLQYKRPVQRLLINDLNPAAIKKSLTTLKNNEEFITFSQSAEARSKADWLYGLNMTRLYTILGQAGGHQGVLSVGRVQTPLLGLVVRRDLDIEQFKAKPYYKLTAEIEHRQGNFHVIWQPPQDSQAIDEENRLLDRQIAEDIVNKIKGKTGQVTVCNNLAKKEHPPLPYSLADIQIDASKKWDLSAKEVLDICQRLYEIHKAITYPRSDCSYLPTEHLNDSKSVIDSIAHNLHALAQITQDLDLALRSKAWDDTKITAHHAIIPTPNKIDISKLSQPESNVYSLIAKRYLVQFLPAMEFIQMTIEVVIDNELFKASGRQIQDQGWTRLYKQDAAFQDEKIEADRLLPQLSMGEHVIAKNVELAEMLTQPPQHFSDATLIKAMTNIAKFVTDKELKKVLKETDGIGTPATQAQIIQTLYDRHYIVKKGKYILSTSTARTLIATLPEIATTPDMTAIWEKNIRQIISGETSLDNFLLDIKDRLHTLITHGKEKGPLAIEGIKTYPCTKSDCKGRLIRHLNKEGQYWWGCSEFKIGCKITAEDDNNQPLPSITKPCTEATCSGQLIKRISKKGGYWWGCSEFKNGCKITHVDAI